MPKKLSILLALILALAQTSTAHAVDERIQLEGNKPAAVSGKEPDEHIQLEGNKPAENKGEGIKDKNKPEPPKIGNFSLPTSQQPSGLFAFGGNVIDEGEVQLYFFADDFVGRRKTTIDMIPSILFGVTDNFSIYFNAPFTPKLQDGYCRSKGLEDFFIQFEYAFYNKKNYCYTGQATLVANITVPTGSVRKRPPTGFGSPTFFIGGTYYYMMIDWFLFTSHGALLTTSDHHTKIGDQFLYQCGIGRNLPSPKGWIYAWMLEIDGQYSQRNRIRGRYIHNSGGNVIYATPSIWISSKNLLVQFGISLPLNQNLFGNQNKINYALNFNIAYSFY